MDIYLDQIQDIDFDRMYSIFMDEKIAETFMIPEFKSEDERRKCIQTIIKYSTDEGYYIRGIYKNRKLIGFINDLGIEDGCVELGWVLRSDYHGKGYGTKAVSMAIEELRHMGINKITAGAFEDNIASIRVMEKCGFQKENRESYLNYLAKKHRCVYYSLEISTK